MSAPARPPALRAVLFDLDGTLYPKVPLRALMALELAALPLRARSFGAARRAWRALSVFRRQREGLRALGDGSADLAGEQYRRIAPALGLEPEALRALVEEWIHRRPLRHMRRIRGRSLPAVLDGLAARGLALGVFSDYPARAKLEAMGVAGRLDPILDAEDPAISALKPHPKGLLAAAGTWGLDPATVLYVGDRRAVDGGAAAAAGMPCVILGAGRPAPGDAWAGLRRLADLPAWIDARDGR